MLSVLGISSTTPVLFMCTGAALDHSVYAPVEKGDANSKCALLANGDPSCKCAMLAKGSVSVIHVWFYDRKGTQGMP